MPRPRSSGRAQEPAVTIAHVLRRAALHLSSAERGELPAVPPVAGPGVEEDRDGPSCRAAAGPRRGRRRVWTAGMNDVAPAAVAVAVDVAQPLGVAEAVEAEAVGLLGQRVVRAGRVEHRLEVLDQVEAPARAGEVRHRVGRDPQRGDRDVGGGHLASSVTDAVVEGDRRVGEGGEGGGERRAEEASLGPPSTTNRFSTPWSRGQLVGDAQRGVDAAVERAVDVGEEPVDGPDLVAAGRRGVSARHRAVAAWRRPGRSSASQAISSSSVVWRKTRSGGRACRGRSSHRRRLSRAAASGGGRRSDRLGEK